MELVQPSTVHLGDGIPHVGRILKMEAAHHVDK